MSHPLLRPVVVSGAVTLGLVLFGALFVDVGQLQVARAELKTATDAAAHAAAHALDGSEESSRLAVIRALALAGSHRVGGEPVWLRAEGVELGRWDGEAFEASSTPIDAVLVRAHHPWQGLLLGRLLPAPAVQARSVAFHPPPQPASAVPCTLPLALSDCNFDDDEEGSLAPFFDLHETDGLLWAVPEDVLDTASPVAAHLQRLGCGPITDTLRLVPPPPDLDLEAWLPAEGFLPLVELRCGEPPDTEAWLRVTGVARARLVHHEQAGIRAVLDLDPPDPSGVLGGGQHDAGVLFLPPPRLVR